MQEDIYILGIESSCDDTSAAVLKNGVLLSNVTASQAVHEAYGGVVPELASRAHQQNVVPVVDQAIKRAGITKEQLSAVAFTRGPGLMGSLLVGVSFAKGLARSLGIPMIDVNHLQGHVMAHFIKESDDDQHMPPLPFLCLLVSGGNSQIVKVNAYNDMEVLGQTIWRVGVIRKPIRLQSRISPILIIASLDLRPRSSIRCRNGWLKIPTLLSIIRRTSQPRWSGRLWIS